MRVPETGALGCVAAAVWLVFAMGCSESSVAKSASPGNRARSGPESGAGEDSIAIQVGQVERGTLSALYTTSATLRADKQATVTARTRGVIRQLLVEEGNWVEAGQPLAILEDDEQRITFDQAQATSETKRRAHERAEQLHRQGLMSDEEYETARREAAETRQSAALAELTLSRTVIRAMFSGRVLTRYLDVGATVNDGTAVYDIADLDPLYADVQVPERQVAELAAGQTVRLVTDGGEVSSEAEIERIAPVVDAATGTVKVTVAVARAPGLRPGSFVRVGIVTDTHENALVVPRSALVAEGRRWHLFRLAAAEDAPRVELIEVTRGFEEGDRVEILEGSAAERPLREGDRVVVTGASSLSDGSLVEVSKPADGAEAPNAANDDGAQGAAA